MFVGLRAYGSYDRSITDLDFLRFFPHLRQFSADALYDSLTSLEGLNYLPVDAQSIAIGQTRKRLSLAPLARFTGLRQVNVLPPMRGLTSLRRVWLETMKGVTDLSPLRDAPALRQLALVDMSHLQPEALRPLVGHPTLTDLRAGLGSKKKNEAAYSVVPLQSEGDWRKPVWLE